MDRVFALAAAASVLAVTGAGCSGVETLPPPSEPPMKPVLEPGMATLQGRVFEVGGRPVIGATVTMLETPAGQNPRTATSSNSGSWELVIPGDTSVTLRVEASGYAPTLSNAVSVGKGQTSSEMELMLLSPSQIDQLNGMGGARPAEYGVAALEVRSVSGACDTTGGKIFIEPSQLGKVMYGRHSDSMPDPALTGTQAGVKPAAWVLGVLPPGTYYNFRFEKAGCTQKAAPLTFRGRSYDGTLSIVTKALSHGVLFVE
jgi:hypothetical protein